MKIKIFLKSEFKKTPPKLEISTSKNNYQLFLDRETIFVKNFDLLQKDILKINFLNKDGIDNNIVFIKNIQIDDIDLQHYIFKGIFYPEYDEQWVVKQKEKPPVFYKPCTELRLKGVWKLDITTPIWKMIMEKWLNDNR